MMDLTLLSLSCFLLLCSQTQLTQALYFLKDPDKYLNSFAVASLTDRWKHSSGYWCLFLLFCFYFLLYTTNYKNQYKCKFIYKNWEFDCTIYIFTFKQDVLKIKYCILKSIYFFRWLWRYHNRFLCNNSVVIKYYVRKYFYYITRKDI